LQSVAVAAFRIVSWNKDVIVELVFNYPVTHQYYTWWIWDCFGYPFGEGIKSSGNYRASFDAFYAVYSCVAATAASAVCCSWLFACAVHLVGMVRCNSCGIV